MRRIKVVDSSELAVAKFLIYLFIWGPFTVTFISLIYGTYKKEIVKEKRNHYLALKPYQNIIISSK